MQRASGQGTDQSVDSEMWRSKPYEGFRAATPPTPVRHVPKRQQLKTATVARPESETLPGAAGTMELQPKVDRARKWSLFRSNSTQSKVSENTSLVPRDTMGSTTDKSTSKSTLQQLKKHHGSSATNSMQSIDQSRNTKLKQLDQSWTVKLAIKSGSRFNIKQSTNTRPTKSGNPPRRPPRPSQGIESLDHVVQSSSSFSELEPGEASSRIDSYGWENIKPLPGRGKGGPGERTVPRRRQSVVSESCYSLELDEDESPHLPVLSADTKVQMDKHRKTAFWRLDGNTKRRQDRSLSSTASTAPSQTTDRKGKTPIRPPVISNRTSAIGTEAKTPTNPRLTAVTEEGSEPDYDKPLPAPPTSSNESKGSGSVRKKESQVILPRGQYQPWWEEQEIKENDLCFDVDEGRDSSLEVKAPSTDRTQPSNDKESENDSTDSPEKSVLPTEIARSYVDEQERAEDRERQERYRKQMRGRRLGKQMHQMSDPKKESRVDSGISSGKGKWRFSVFESEIESRATTSNNSSESSTNNGVSKAKAPTATVSASASTLTLLESEKVKMRPLPLRVNTAKANQAPIARPAVISFEDQAQEKPVEHPSALPTPLAIPATRADLQQGATRQAVMRLSDGTPVHSPHLIRRNGEVLLPPKSPISPIEQVRHSSDSSVSSEGFWSDHKNQYENRKESRSKKWMGKAKAKETQPDTPPTGNTLDYNYSYNAMVGDRKRDEDADDKFDILDFYLDHYDADLPPAVPERSPSRSIAQDPPLSPGIAAPNTDINVRNSTTTTTSDPFRDSYEHDHFRNQRLAEDDEEERLRWEDEERHKRVAAILGRLREKSSCPVIAAYLVNEVDVCVWLRSGDDYEKGVGRRMVVRGRKAEVDFV